MKRPLPVLSILLVIATSAAMLTMAGCGARPHETTETYFLIATNTKVPYWQEAYSGLMRATSELKVKAVMMGPENYDTSAERDAFHAAAAQKPAGILVSAADAVLITPEINAAIARGIPVITIDSDAPNSKRLFFVGTDNYHAGRLGGNLVSQLLHGKGNVVVFTMPGQPNLQDRLHGYQVVFADRPQIKLTEAADVKGDPALVSDMTKQLLESKTPVDAFVCLIAIACPEVGEVVTRAHREGKVTIVAMDTDPRTLEWIQKGVIAGTIAQRPFTMAYIGTKLLDEIHHYPPTPLDANWNRNSLSPIPTLVDTGTFVVDKGNVRNFLQPQNKP